MNETNNVRALRVMFYLSLFITLLAWAVIQLGAYTRLTEAGLGCPDWPGCYGHLNVSQLTSNSLAAMNTLRAAWTEMIHRYIASGLIAGLLVLSLMLIRQRKSVSLSTKVTMGLLVLIIFFQAALGMWTVTEKLHPTIVTLHLLGGMSLVALLVWLTMSLSQWYPQPETRLIAVKPWAWGVLLLLILQIALGGWTSTNYAALACPTFPDCNGLWLPPASLKEAFTVFSSLGINYQGGVFAMAIRMTIQILHRFGALILSSYLLILVTALFMRTKLKAIRINAGLILFMLVMQLCLGIINVLALLPLSTAVAHNGGAALLLMSLVILNYQLSYCKKS